MNECRVLFAGTPEFALASLSALVDNDIRPHAVLTQPDRPAGRGKKLSASPVKRFAVDHGIDVLQPTSLKDDSVVNAITALKPDILIVAAYGIILPQAVLDIPTHGCLNVHASLLPRWRGAAPIQAAILAGDATTGVSLMSMTAGLDCGPVFVTEAIDIGEDETAGELHDRLAALGGELLVKHLDAIIAGRLRASEQDESLANFAGKIKPADARLDWSLAADLLARRVRAYNPVPGAWFKLDDERIKCWRATSADVTGAPGEVQKASRDGVVVACGEGGLALRKLQRPGKRPIDAGAFAAQLEIVGKTLG